MDRRGILNNRYLLGQGSHSGNISTQKLSILTVAEAKQRRNHIENAPSNQWLVIPECRRTRDCCGTSRPRNFQNKKKKKSK